MPLHTRIVEVVEENPAVKTFRFRYNVKVLPGQFCMVWDGAGEEVPMSFSYTGKIKGVTVKKVGKTTDLLHRRKPGEVLRIRGPFGTHYPVSSKKYLLVSGGTGIASLAPAAEKIVGRGGKCRFVAGFRNASEIFFIERLRNAGIDVEIATDDGSAGFRGFVTELAGKLFAGESFDYIIACGPVQMLKEIGRRFAEKVETYISIESLMKCGIGLCDSCSILGYRVCREGPVFRAGELIEKGWLEE
ncbi:MAG: dihydroorotate dehydrogenase electron transfer subunit [Thermoplasmata archaeon]|nr:dihydroorotate dehydrogenase electron transfer subunit [Thermoplasmata archaeon]